MKKEMLQILENSSMEEKETKAIYAELLNLFTVSKCTCPPLVACEICGEEKNLDGDFWINKKKHDC